jgi:hypothetical protein
VAHGKFEWNKFQGLIRASTTIAFKTKHEHDVFNPERSQSTTPLPVQLDTTQSVQQLYRYGTTRCSDLGTVLYRTDIAANVIDEEEEEERWEDVEGGRR